MAGHNHGLRGLQAAHPLHDGDADGGQPHHHGVAVRRQPHPVHRARDPHARGEHVLLDLVDVHDAGRL